MCGVQPVRRRLGDAGEETTARVLLAEREEPLQQTALVHHLDAARVQAERNSPASIKPVGPAPATITSITDFRRYWLRPEILRHDPGLAARPPVRSTSSVARSG